MLQTFESADFSIEIGSIIDSSLSDFIGVHYSNCKIVIIVDENSNDYCLEYLITSFSFLSNAEIVVIPVGEQYKEMDVCLQVWEALSEYQITRSDLIINVGGGVVTDLGGFVASVYKRGLQFMNVPTTLLGMVDASIGGKTGIDLGSFKNQLGIFSHPQKIYVDTCFLSSLPEVELLNGFAEMLKHALITDIIQWDQLSHITELKRLIDEKLISQSIQVKFDMIVKDPFERNIRKKLNMGHTIGHALEGYFLNENPIQHGHAVALGIVAESYISLQKGILKKSKFNEIKNVILRWFKPIFINDDAIQFIVQLTKNDKKNNNGQINCSLLTEIGSCDIDCIVNEQEIIDALYFLNSV